MVQMREEQIKSNVNEAIDIVATELTQYKGSFLASNRSAASGNILTEDYSDFLSKPQTVGRRFSVEELRGKISNAFRQVRLDKMDFEFAVEIMRSSIVEKQSANYQQALLDTANNYNHGAILVTPSGSAAENIALDELLTVVALSYKKFALKSLKWNFIMAIFFSLIILAAFYLTVRTMLRQKKAGRDQE